MIHWRRLNGDHDARIDAVEQHGTRVVVALSWADKTGKRHDWAHVLQLNEGKILEIQDYANPSRAVAAARLRAVFS